MSDYPNNVEVHRWAEAQPWGHKVSGIGISKQLIMAWNKAHPDRPYVPSEAYHGTYGGYYAHNCRCERCIEAASEQSLGQYHARQDEAAGSSGSQRRRAYRPRADR